LVFTAVTAALRASENGKFSCSVDAKSTATYKKQVDQACFASFDQAYNSPIPLYGFGGVTSHPTPLPWKYGMRNFRYKYIVWF
jgi:hypothetical protein